jgi:hypothetical protein
MVKRLVPEKETHPSYTYNPEWDERDWQAAIEEAGERTVARAREEYVRWLEEPLPGPIPTRGFMWWLRLSIYVLVAVGGYLWWAGNTAL